MEKLNIGWIGLGNMGKPMSAQLIKAGYKLTVFNRNKDKAQSLLDMGVEVSASPADLLKLNDIVFLMVSDDEAIKQIFTGAEGLLEQDLSNKIIVNMSTVSPGISKEMALLCKAKNGTYLDAPVSGSVKQAETGTLVIMVGGDEAAFNEVKPIFDKLGKLAMLVGETSAGNNAKLAINGLLALHAQGLAEAVLFAQSKNIDTQSLLTLIENSAIGNIFSKIKGEAILNDNYNAAFALKHIVKDLNLAKNEGLNTPLAKTALNTFEKAAPEYENEDIIAVFKAMKS
ncbi:NAD(P)-dependent oxidoreductase [Pedobacter sp. Leaf132]|uniref:NAD(P)-dependent oxidoreductase n=1 Tax=Pedobacter sp. Leaf132 TaxID=2876557 RepID=UPI001E4194D6|nr:NAD(P)-dependent oxidoreductase [Pedobacter sp. Leaf132]